MKIGLLQKIRESEASKFLFDLNLGLEKECIRVDRDGFIANTPHPKGLGDKLNHPYITTDFAESQLELITKPLDSISETYGFLETLFDIVCEALPKNEYIWEQSAPPPIKSEEEIQLASFGPKGLDKEMYREHLAREYGKKRQLYSGIHYNFSFSDEFLRQAYSLYEKDYESLQDFTNEIYLKTTRQLLKYRWMMIQLLGASPATHRSLEGNKDCLMKGAKDFHYLEFGTSARTGVCGYRNKEDFYINYEGVEEYQKSIDSLIEEKKIDSAKELYSPVRVKFNSDNQIQYLEIRLLDNFPFSKIGVSKTALYNLHGFILNCLLLDEEVEFDAAEQKKASENHDKASAKGRQSTFTVYHGQNSTESAILLAKHTAFFRDSVLTLCSDKELLPIYQDALSQLVNFIENPDKRPANQLLEKIQKEGFVDFHMRLAKANKSHALEKSYRFHGLEDLELSTQLLLKACLRRGIHFKLLDRQSNFVELSQNGHLEYVQQATKTSLDSYASILTMENKIVTKYLLEKNGISTPKGGNYSDKNKALRDFVKFKNRAIVIKPNSTNFGLGITILKENTDREIYNRAIEIAFEYDPTILIESFVSGKEYRMFVIEDQVVGILHRVPANIIGDGISTITELIDHKNQNPLRGKGYKTPLEKIQKGEAEELFLKTQGLDLHSIVPKGKQVFLRENSNISTGGDSIDYTDDIHQSYKDIAVQAAKALGV